MRASVGRTTVSLVAVSTGSVGVGCAIVAWLIRGCCVMSSVVVLVAADHVLGLVDE